MDDQVEAFQVGVIPGILNFEVALWLIHRITVFSICNNQMLVEILIALGFIFPKHTIKVALGILVANKILFPGNCYFQK